MALMVYGSTISPFVRKVLAVCALKGVEVEIDPIVAFFAIKWLPRQPAQAMMMMGLQAFAALLALAPVVFFSL